MGLLLALLAALVVALWLSLSRLRERLEHVEGKLIDAFDLIRTLQRDQVRQAKGPADAAAPGPQPETAREPAPAATPPKVAAPAPASPAVEPRHIPPVPRPVQQPVAAATRPPSARERIVSVTPAARTASSATAAAPAESWELTVGTSWLNKIGVLVLVIGLAFLVGYSFAHIGPLGRVAIGLALAGAMLGTGVWLEPRPGFRNYAYGLVAGGWAGIYFTTFAMHGVPAARILESEITAVVLLLFVAGGMIAHSLRYRSQVVTALAFVVAYVTLSLSPLSGFSLAASVPLALAVLGVSQRLGWPAISTLAIVATYGAFVLRAAVFPGGAMAAGSAIPYLTLAAYWVTFEVADLIGLRYGNRAATPSMLALNAVGFLGALMVSVPLDQPVVLSTVLFSTGVAYVASAVARAWLIPDRRQQARPDQPFDVSHAATAIATGLFAVAVALRFSGAREGLGWLLEAQLLFVAGLVLGDRWLRGFASGVAALVSVHTWLRCVPSVAVEAPSLALGVDMPSAVAITVAMIWYANRESLRIRGLVPWSLEPGYTWSATGLVATAGIATLEPAYLGFAGVLLAALLLEVGIRRDRAYTRQSYVIGALAGYAALIAYLIRTTSDGQIPNWGPVPGFRHALIVLPACIAIYGAVALRLSRLGQHSNAPRAAAAAGTAFTIATWLTVLFEWRVLPAEFIAPAWAMTGLGVVLFGARRALVMGRLLGYAVVALAAVRQITPLIAREHASLTEMLGSLVVILCMYASAYWGRQAVPAAEGDDKDSLEVALTSALNVWATAAFVLFKYRVLAEVLVAPAWASTGFVLVWLGASRSRVGQRLQGYGVCIFAAWHLLMRLLPAEGAPASEIWSGVAVTALIYATAWLTRRHSTRLDMPAGEVLMAAGTALGAVILWRVFSGVTVGPAWTLFGAGLLAIGLARMITDLRWHGYALLTLGTLRAASPVFSGADTTPPAIIGLLASIGTAFSVTLVSRRVLKARGAGPSELPVSAAMLAGAAGLLGMLILQELETSMVTPALGFEGLVLMVLGLLTRERVLRLSGLVLLLAALLKVFFYDLRALEPLARILSFVVLGMVLLGISWTYTKYREQIKKLL